MHFLLLLAFHTGVLYYLPSSTCGTRHGDGHLREVDPSPPLSFFTFFMQIVREGLRERNFLLRVATFSVKEISIFSMKLVTTLHSF